MRRILAIFRKDARHLWPQAAALSLLMAVAAVFDPTYSGRRAIYYYLLPSFVLPLTCWLIVISAIHEEKLPGDRQYWLTRPYSWKELAAAKILFVVAFVNLPLLAYHLCVYVALGIPVRDHFGALFWRQIFFTAFYLLPAAALGAITRTLERALATALVGGVGLYIASMALGLFIARRPFMLGTLLMTDPTQFAAKTDLVIAAVLVVGVAAILALQYARRATAVARTLAAAIAVAVLGPSAYTPAYGRQSLNTSRQPAQLSLDSGPDRNGHISSPTDPDFGAFDIPVRVNATTPGEQLDRTFVNLTMRVPSRRFLSWTALGEFHGLSGGRAWLSFVYRRQLLEAVHGEPVIVSGSFDLQLFQRELALPLPKRAVVVAPGVGVCRDSRDPEGSISFICYSPFPRAALMVGAPGRRANWIVSPGSVEGPIPLASGFQPVSKFSSLLTYGSWSEIGDMKLIAAQPLPPLRLTFRLFPVALQDYLVDKPK